MEQQDISEDKEEPLGSESEQKSRPRESVEIPEVIRGVYSKKFSQVLVEKDDDAKLLESKGFGIRDNKNQFHLRDYEVLYLLYTKKLIIKKEKKNLGFESFVVLASKRDENAWTRFLIYRDLRTRGYVVREGFGFPIDFRIYDRGDYGLKAAKYIVFGLNEGKTMTMGELRKNVEDMSRMGKEAVVAVVERRGEVIYYKVGKWHPVRPLAAQTS
jgi:tRNA-intron endonuclease, archaea type